MFNNFNVWHTAIYLGGILCLVVLNIYQSQQFLIKAVRQDTVILNNLYPESTFYKFINEYGYCEVSRLSRDISDESEIKHAQYSTQQSERPCTARNYYLFGEGLLFLSLIPVFLLLSPLFSGSNLNQRIYNRAFYISLGIILLLVFNMFYELFYNPPPREYVPRFDPLELLTWGGLVVNLCFLGNGWGRHRENLSKFLLLLAILFIPLIGIWILLAMSFTT